MRKRRDERDPVPIAGTEGGVSPFFSPDGKWIGYVTADGRLRKVSVDGRRLDHDRRGCPSGPGAATWLDNGTIVYAGAVTEL